MAKSYYLANVGRTIFLTCDNSTVIGMADTLTATSFDLSVTEEELRGGPGNPLLASTFHDQTLNLTYTDALISINMLAAMVGDTGATSTTAGAYMYTESITASSATKLTLTKTPIGSAKTSDGICVWYHKEGETEWIMGFADSSSKEVTGAFTSGATYCVKYLIATSGNDDRTINLNADYVPSVIHAIQYIDVYEAAQAGCAQAAGAIGQLVIDIPMFQLNGNAKIELSTTPGTNEISGKALATQSVSCTGSTSTFGTMYFGKKPV